MSEFFVWFISQASFWPLLFSSSAINIALSLQAPIIGDKRKSDNFSTNLLIALISELGILPIDIVGG